MNRCEVNGQQEKHIAHGNLPFLGVVYHIHDPFFTYEEMTDGNSYMVVLM